jgi:hypothetical protein
MDIVPARFGLFAGFLTSNPTTKFSKLSPMIMNTLSTHKIACLSVVSLAMLCISSSTFAFIDERTPPPPPTPVASPIQTPAIQVAAPAAPVISGNFSELAWMGAFQPETMGLSDLNADHKIPLADAILTISPTQAGTFRLDGDSELLARRVQIEPAATRKAALERVALNAGVAISRTGDALLITQNQRSTGTTGQQAGPSVSPLFGTAEKTVWAIRPEDGTVRQTLIRWAKTAGWAFSSNLWTVPVDIPVIASATFNGNFKKAVQELMTATELGDTPVQACFYENLVIRVVPYAERCDRTSAD